MSLRDFDILPPIKADHPLAEHPRKCWVCNRVVGQGVRIALVPFHTPEETGSYTVDARIVCGTCHLRGKTVNTPVGLRVVDKVKDGDGSPYPVVTTDNQQWKDEEIQPNWVTGKEENQ